MRQIISVAFLTSFLFVPFAAWACPKCKACKIDHDQVCTAECLASDVLAKDGAECHKKCLKSKCHCDCSCDCLKEDATEEEKKAPPTQECVEQCKIERNPPPTSATD